MADITIPAGDYGFNLIFTIATASGAAYDLTGKTINFYVWKSGDPGAPYLSAAATISTASTGICSYTPASTDFTVKGKYICELEFTEVGKRDSTRYYTLEVTESA